MPEYPYVTDEAREAIGKETVTVSDAVSLRHIKEYLAGTGEWDPLYYDEEYAKQTPYGGVIAPPLFHGAIVRRVVPESDLKEDGQYTDIAVRGVFGRTLAGGISTELFNPIRVGDVITQRTKLVDIQEKQGRSGKLVLCLLEATCTNQRGELVAIDKSTLIFR